MCFSQKQQLYNHTNATGCKVMTVLETTFEALLLVYHDELDSYRNTQTQ